MSDQRDQLCRGCRETAADEGKPGRETPFREFRHPVSLSPLPGSFSESRDKPSVGFNHRSADLPAEGVYPRRERALGLHRLAERMLSQDLVWAEWLTAAPETCHPNLCLARKGESVRSACEQERALIHNRSAGARATR